MLDFWNWLLPREEEKVPQEKQSCLSPQLIHINSPFRLRALFLLPRPRSPVSPSPVGDIVQFPEDGLERHLWP